MGEPQVPATFERSAPAGSNSLAFPGSGAGLPEYEIPPGLSCERVKGDRLPAQMLWAPHFREGAFVGEPQVPTTFERSASAAEYPPAGGPAYTVSRDKPKALRAFGLFTESFGVRLMNLLSF